MCTGLKACPKGLGQWSLSPGGCGFLSLFFSLSFSCPSPPYTSGSPHQLTRNKGADGGRKEAWMGRRERDRNGRKGSLSSLGRLPSMQEDRTAQCHCECPVYERKHRYCTHRQEALPHTCTFKYIYMHIIGKYTHGHKCTHVQMHVIAHTQKHAHSYRCQWQWSQHQANWTDLYAAVVFSSEKRGASCRALALTCQVFNGNFCTRL